MARSLDLHHLSCQSDSTRDNEWERTFFQALVESKVQVADSEPSSGGDGLPYLFVKTSPQGTEPVVKILDWLATRGIGLVVNGHKDVPDYVFPFGMIWNWKERGEFLSAANGVAPGQVEIKAGEQILAGPPTTQYLPLYVRQILFQFLKSQGVGGPRVLVVSNDRKHFDLCFSLESLGSPPSHEHRGIAEALSWFLPQHYSLMLISEKGLPPFVKLE